MEISSRERFYYADSYCRGFGEGSVTFVPCSWSIERWIWPTFVCILIYKFFFRAGGKCYEPDFSYSVRLPFVILLFILCVGTMVQGRDIIPDHSSKFDNHYRFFKGSIGYDLFCELFVVSFAWFALDFLNDNFLNNIVYFILHGFKFNVDSCAIRILFQVAIANCAYDENANFIIGRNHSFDSIIYSLSEILDIRILIIHLRVFQISSPKSPWFTVLWILLVPKYWIV